MHGEIIHGYQWDRNSGGGIGDHGDLRDGSFSKGSIAG